MTGVLHDRRVALGNDLELAVALLTACLETTRLVFLLLERLLQRLRPASILALVRLAHAVAHANKLTIDIFHTSSDRVRDSLLNLPLYEARRERAQSFVKRVMLRVADRELERVNLDMDVLYFENRRAILVGRDEVYCGLTSTPSSQVYRPAVLQYIAHRQTLSSQQHVCQARI